MLPFRVCALVSVATEQRRNQHRAGPTETNIFAVLKRERYIDLFTPPELPPSRRQHCVTKAPARLAVTLIWSGCSVCMHSYSFTAILLCALYAREHLQQQWHSIAMESNAMIVSLSMDLFEYTHS